MKIFDFFKRMIKKEDTLDMRFSTPKRQVKQGIYRERGYFPPNPLCNPRTDPEFFMYEEGKYEDDLREGVWVIEDKDGKRRGYTNYEKGKKHGLAKSPHGVYTLYHHGQAIKSHHELIKEWKRNVKEWKMVKEGDKEGRSNALKEVLAAKTKEGKKEVLRRFHSSKTPQGYTRRTAVKLNKKPSRD